MFFFIRFNIVNQKAAINTDCNSKAVFENKLAEWIHNKVTDENFETTNSLKDFLSSLTDKSVNICSSAFTVQLNETDITNPFLQ